MLYRVKNTPTHKQNGNESQPYWNCTMPLLNAGMPVRVAFIASFTELVIRSGMPRITFLPPEIVFHVRFVSHAPEIFNCLCLPVVGRVARMSLHHFRINGIRVPRV